jgi:hypothetical protein
VDDPRVEELYAAPLEEFTARRNELAKAIAAEGDKEAAAAVRKLQKPNATGWALNQLARSESAAVNQLLETAERLRAAQRGESGDLRGLHREVRDQVAKLLAGAQSIVEGAGKHATQTLKNQVTQSLMAAAAEETAGAQLRAGQLTRELEPGGFDRSDDLFVASQPETSSSRHRKEAQERVAVLAKEAEEAQSEAEQLAEEAGRAERSARRARARAEDAAATAEALRARADAAQNALQSEPE